MRLLRRLHRRVALLIGLVLLQGSMAGPGHACDAEHGDGHQAHVVAAAASTGHEHGTHTTAPSSDQRSSCPIDESLSCAVPGAMGGCAVAACVAVASARSGDDGADAAREPVTVPRVLDSSTRAGAAPDVPPPRA